MVSETAKNLKYLNISGSVVTDQVIFSEIISSEKSVAVNAWFFKGLLYLCGVQRGEDTRMHLSRRFVFTTYSAPLVTD